MNSIQEKQRELTFHPVYKSLTSMEMIRHFMEYHVFAVWDFMSLLKSLQIKLTCVSLPWRPSPYPAEMIRLINQIVLGEESDVDQSGNPVSHFDLYLQAMEEVGANTRPIREFIRTNRFDLIPPGAREFVEFNLNVATQGHIVEVAANFFFGREKLIPEMFQSIVKVLTEEKVEAPILLYYLQRHIEVDGEEHGPLAQKALTYLTGNSPDLINMAVESGTLALEYRKSLWDNVLLAGSEVSGKTSTEFHCPSSN
jgi:hypothetical protein